MKRSDRHAPSSKFFDPLAYRYMGVYDTDKSADSKARMQAVSNLVTQGYKFGHGSSSQCGHCGAHIRYAALMVRDDIKEFIFVGEDCLDNRFSGLTKDEFQRLRKAAKLNRERERISERVTRYIDQHPWLADLKPDSPNWFLGDMYRSLHKYGELTEKQLAATRKALDGEKKYKEIQAKREEEKQALLDAGVKAPTGKQRIIGTVTNVKLVDGAYGCAWKMRVVTDQRWSVWVTVPSTVVDDVVDKETGKVKAEGIRIKFVATLTASKDDPTFVFGARPSQAKIISVSDSEN